MTGRVAFAVTAVPACGGSFFVYAYARASAATVGCTWDGTWSGVSACLCVSVPVLAVMFVWVSVASRGRRTLSGASVAALAAGLLAGCFLGEQRLLSDEVAFAAHVARHPAAHYARRRAWPCGETGLVYEPGRGTRATNLVLG